MARLHTHSCSGATENSEGHTHVYYGITNACADMPGHTYRFSGRTPKSLGNTHRYAVADGPEAAIGAGHYHFYRGVACFMDGHNYVMEGHTSLYR